MTCSLLKLLLLKIFGEKFCCLLRNLPIAQVLKTGPLWRRRSLSYPCAPGCPEKVADRMLLEPKILIKIGCCGAKFSHGQQWKKVGENPPFQQITWERFNPFSLRRKQLWKISRDELFKVRLRLPIARVPVDQVTRSHCTLGLAWPPL